MTEERLQPISLHQEMQRSYLEYAMSVIVGRALPDARDGLKPVQRRILYAMHELGLNPDRPYRKCARVVGDVLGKYHPHGDQAVYDALVRLVQKFSSRYPVLDGHGNFGSVDDDPPAAMRYTETRLAPIAHESLLNEIGDNTVDFAGNFDGSQQEPLVLPAQLPFLLLNGCSGIAVGMATSIPPHNLNEIIDGLIALIKKPNLSDEKLLKIIPGPDFPTGGEILLGSGIKETYLKGRGSIPMRGITHIEEIHPGKGKHKRSAVIVTELPYQLSKAGWIEKLADLVNDGKLNGIADIRDESDRDGMRVVVELRRDVDPEQIKKDLYRRTSLQCNFGAILLALINGQPKQLSLRGLLTTFIEFRETTLIKRIKNSLTKIGDRLEIVEGLIKALNNLKNVIEMIQIAKDASEAKAKLIVHLNVSDKQADGILAMPLRRLTNLEQNNLHKESKELVSQKNELNMLLNDRNLLLEKLINELKILKKKFGNKRRTNLIEGGDELIAERNATLRPNAELQRKNAFNSLPPDSRLLIQADQQVKIVSRQIVRRLHLLESCDFGEEPSPAQVLCAINKKPQLLALTTTGRIGIIRWEFAGQQPGLLEKFLPGGLEGETIATLLALPKEKNVSLALLSSDGRIKRLSIEEILDLSGRAATILKLKDGVKLISAIVCYQNSEIIISSNIGRVLRINVNNENFPIMGKLAQGQTTMRLLPGEFIVGAISGNRKEKNSIALITKKGKIEKKIISLIRTTKRGDLGEMCIQLDTHKRTLDEVIGIFDDNIMIGIVTTEGRCSRVNLKDINSISGNTFIKNKLQSNEFIKELIPLISTELTSDEESI